MAENTKLTRYEGVDVYVSPHGKFHCDELTRYYDTLEALQRAIDRRHKARKQRKRVQQAVPVYMVTRRSSWRADQDGYTVETATYTGVHATHGTATFKGAPDISSVVYITTDAQSAGLLAEKAHAHREAERELDKAVRETGAIRPSELSATRYGGKPSEEGLLQQLLYNCKKLGVDPPPELQVSD